MIVMRRERSGTWLPVTTLMLLGLAALALLGSGLRSSQALAPIDGIQVRKSVNVLSLLPGQTPYPLYTVTIQNSTDGDLVLDRVVDTLPAGFAFAFVNQTLSDWDFAPVVAGQELTWTGTEEMDMTVPASGQLSLVYAVRVPSTVPESAVPYANTAQAWAEDGTFLGEATASLIVGQAELSLDKVASPIQVVNGQPVTFTITLANSGEVTGTVDMVTDTLDAELTYAGLVPGGDLGAPVQSPLGTLVWEGPISIPPGTTLTQSYRANTPAGTTRYQACNHLEISSVDSAPQPVEACVSVQPPHVFVYMPVLSRDFQFAWLSVDKSVSPPAILAGSTADVVYTVTIVNQGDTTGTLLSIEDTLPPGLTFLGMAPGSDVATPPSGTTGTITWRGNWPMPPGERVDVVYRVRANVPEGAYANAVLVTARDAQVPEKAAVAILQSEVPIAGLAASNDSPTHQGRPTVLSASVSAGSNVVYTWDFGDGTTGTGASVSHVYPAVQTYVATVTAKNGISQATATTTVTIEPAVLLDENFNDPSVGISHWTKFLNYWRLEEGQWYWGATAGVGGSGAAVQDCYLGGTKMAEDALLMYLGPGAEEWTDYRVETKLYLTGGTEELDDRVFVWLEEGGSPIGLWVRGQYTAVDDRGGGWVTGYYVIVGGNPYKNSMYVRLSQLQTLTDCWDAACYNPGNLYDFNNPHTLTEVKLEKAFTRRTWFSLAVEVRGSNIQVFFENEKVIEWNDTKEPFLTGTVGLKTYKSDTAHFDNLLVTPLD